MALPTAHNKAALKAPASSAVDHVKSNRLLGIFFWLIKGCLTERRWESGQLLVLVRHVFDGFFRGRVRLYEGARQLLS